MFTFATAPKTFSSSECASSIELWKATQSDLHLYCRSWQGKKTLPLKRSLGSLCRLQLSLLLCALTLFGSYPNTSFVTRVANVYCLSVSSQFPFLAFYNRVRVFISTEPYSLLYWCYEVIVLCEDEFETRCIVFYVVCLLWRSVCV